MGEYADMMLDGTCCVQCGEYLGGDGDGFPVMCASCDSEVERPKRKAAPVGRYTSPNPDSNRSKKKAQRQAKRRAASS